MILNTIFEYFFLCFFPIGLLLFFMGKRLEWHPKIKLVAQLASAFALLYVFIGLVVTLPQAIIDLIGVILTIVCLFAIVWQISKYLAAYWIIGKPVQGIRSSDFRFSIFWGVLTLISWIGIMITYNDLFSLLAVFTLLLATLPIVRVFRNFQLRERGILYKGRKIRWEEIAAYSWVNINYRDKLWIMLKDSQKIIDLDVHMDQRYPVGDFLKEKLSGLYKRADQMV